MKVIALTGGIGAGKSLVANYFFSLGAEVIDADQLARQAIAQGSGGFEQVVKVFGAGVLSDGDINRKALGAIVFSDPEKRQKLESIIHPIVQQELAAARSKLSEGQILIYEIPLLVETKAAAKFDSVITVEAPLESRIERLKGRGLELSEIEKRIASQATSDERKAVANYIIENDGTEEDLLHKVESVWTEINASRN